MCPTQSDGRGKLYYFIRQGDATELFRKVYDDIKKILSSFLGSVL